MKILGLKIAALAVAFFSVSAFAQQIGVYDSSNSQNFIAKGIDAAAMITNINNVAQSAAAAQATANGAAGAAGAAGRDAQAAAALAASAAAYPWTHYFIGQVRCVTTLNGWGYVCMQVQGDGSLLTVSYPAGYTTHVPEFNSVATNSDYGYCSNFPLILGYPLGINVNNVVPTDWTFDIQQGTGSGCSGSSTSNGSN